MAFDFKYNLGVYFKLYVYFNKIHTFFVSHLFIFKVHLFFTSIMVLAMPEQNNGQIKDRRNTLCK